jgi:hypothetical protein
LEKHFRCLARVGGLAIWAYLGFSLDIRWFSGEVPTIKNSQRQFGVGDWAKVLAHLVSKARDEGGVQPVGLGDQTRAPHRDCTDAGHDLALGQMPVAHQSPPAIIGQFVGMGAEPSRPQSRHSYKRGRLFSTAARRSPQPGQMKPAGQRRLNKNATQLASSGNAFWNSESERALAIGCPSWRLHAVNTNSSDILVDTRPILGADGTVVRIAYPVFGSVSSFLNDVYVAIKGAVRAHAYNKTWVLRNSETGALLSEMGTDWATKNRNRRDDNRRIDEVGIDGGKIYEVLPIKSAD